VETVTTTTLVDRMFQQTVVEKFKVNVMNKRNELFMMSDSFFSELSLGTTSL